LKAGIAAWKAAPRTQPPIADIRTFLTLCCT
jgi:hypothetical protein